MLDAEGCAVVYGHSTSNTAIAREPHPRDFRQTLGMCSLESLALDA